MLAGTMQYLITIVQFKFPLLQALTCLHREYTFFFFFLFCSVDYLLTSRVCYLHCSIRAVVHQPIWPDLIWNSAGIRPVFHCCQQSLCPKTVWQPDHNFWGTHWKLALCNYIYWCLWPAAIHSRIWHNIYWCLLACSNPLPHLAPHPPLRLGAPHQPLVHPPLLPLVPHPLVCIMHSLLLSSLAGSPC